MYLQQTELWKLRGREWFKFRDRKYQRSFSLFLVFLADPGGGVPTPTPGKNSQKVASICRATSLASHRAPRTNFWIHCCNCTFSLRRNQTINAVFGSNIKNTIIFRVIPVISRTPIHEKGAILPVAVVILWHNAVT